MRYDHVLRRIQAAQDKFEGEMRAILSQAGREDAQLARAILDGHKSERGNGETTWPGKPGPKPKRARARRTTTKRTRPGGSQFRKGRSETLAFVVGVVRDKGPIPLSDLSATMKASGHKYHALGGLVRHGYLKKTAQGYVLGHVGAKFGVSA